MTRVDATRRQSNECSYEVRFREIMDRSYE
jgi:hypothetical protein